MDSASPVKHSYTIPCSSAFRDQIIALAERRGVNAGDIARSVLLTVPPRLLDIHRDPGEPLPDDRETVILKSGPAEGRPWRRKPRLQVRMAPGYAITTVRKALALALALDTGQLALKLEDPNRPKPVEVPPPPVQDNTKEELERLRAIVGVLSFEPLDDGVNSREEALFVLGFPPRSRPDSRALRSRFRMLATIHHPDSHYGSHVRMSQLNQAMEFLKES